MKFDKFFGTIFGNIFHVDLKNGMTIEFSCRNDGEIEWLSGCKKPTFIWKNREKYILTQFLYPF